jgi:hypothetical protein
MPIHFIPNDPEAGPTAPPMRSTSPSPTRPAARSGFVYSNTSPQGLAAPGTPQFLFWQAREAAILAVQAFEAASIKHMAWQGNRKKLPLLQDAGVDLNAFYDRASFSFFHEQVGKQTFFSGASTDVVAHEVGHGLLDSLRPDFFSVNFLEVGALHEAFGDCMAILTALEDSATRQALLSVAPDLRKRNFVEGTAEQLSHAIGLAIPGHNASVPRRAFNKLQYQIPSTLPSNGGPGALINEVHSFGMVFTGCFWDLLANLFNAGTQKTPAALLAAARLAGKILIAGAQRAVVTPRFLQSMGRAMTLADQLLHGGANGQRIGDAFKRHNILLGSNAMLAPTALLAGAAPKGNALDAASRKDLARRLGSPRGTKVTVQAAPLFGASAVSAVQTRAVPLGPLHPRLKGVVAMAQEAVTVGASGGRAAVIGAMPNALNTDSEVHAFVESLLVHNRLQLPGAAVGQYPKHSTHVVKSVAGKKVLTRVRFACACHPLRLA